MLGYIIKKTYSSKLEKLSFKLNVMAEFSTLECLLQNMT